jgi:hypothetical protein
MLVPKEGYNPLLNGEEFSTLFKGLCPERVKFTTVFVDASYLKCVKAQ